MFELVVGASFFPVGWDMSWEKKHFFEKVIQGPEGDVLAKLLNMRRDREKRYEHDIDFFRTMSLALGDSYLNVLEESVRRGCPIASGLSPVGGGGPVAGLERSSAAVGKAFHIIRCVLREDALCFPSVKCFADADRLRGDTRFKDFRENLGEFATQIARGDAAAVAKAQKEVRKASVALSSIGQSRKLGRLVTYLSVPTGVIGSLMGSGPLAGILLSVVGAATEAYNYVQEKRYGWIMLGQI